MLIFTLVGCEKPSPCVDGENVATTEPNQSGATPNHETTASFSPPIEVPEPIWKQVERILTNAKVRTIQDYFSEVEKIAPPRSSTAGFQTRQVVEVFSSPAEYVDTYAEHNYPELDPRSARRKVISEIAWKAEARGASLEVAHRVYIDSYFADVTVIKLMYWRVPRYVGFHIITDDDGIIVGWRMPWRPER
jgi:hypothetical protein